MAQRQTRSKLAGVVRAVLHKPTGPSTTAVEGKSIFIDAVPGPSDLVRAVETTLLTFLRYAIPPLDSELEASVGPLWLEAKREVLACGYLRDRPGGWMLSEAGLEQAARLQLERRDRARSLGSPRPVNAATKGPIDVVCKIATKPKEICGQALEEAEEHAGGTKRKTRRAKA